MEHMGVRPPGGTQVLSFQAHHSLTSERQGQQEDAKSFWGVCRDGEGSYIKALVSV